MNLKLLITLTRVIPRPLQSLFSYRETMYRALIIFLSLLSFSECHCFGRHSWRSQHHFSPRRHRFNNPRRDFEDLAQNIIAADRKLQKFCNQNTSEVKEIYSIINYKLIINLPEFNEEDFNIKLKHRVLYISALKQNQSEIKSYEYMNILPVTVDIALTTWKLENGELKIIVPYKNQLIKCESEIDSDTKIVPMSNDPDEPDIDIRLKKDTYETSTPLNENVVY